MVCLPALPPIAAHGSQDVQGLAAHALDARLSHLGGQGHCGAFSYIMEHFKVISPHRWGILGHG